MKATTWGWLVGALATAAACGSGARDPGQTPEAISPVRLSGPRGSMGGTEIHNDPRVRRDSVPAPLESVWRILPAVYADLGIADAGADTAQQVYGNPDFTPRRIGGERLSRYIDCGTGITAMPKADEYEVTMSVLTRVAAAAPGETALTTVVMARARARGHSANAVYCQSTGALETQVMARVIAALQG